MLLPNTWSCEDAVEEAVLRRFQAAGAHRRPAEVASAVTHRALAVHAKHLPESVEQADIAANIARLKATGGPVRLVLLPPSAFCCVDGGLLESGFGGSLAMVSRQLSPLAGAWRWFRANCHHWRCCTDC
eukprot:4207309-Pleurochrysis_carterae.AAC.2